MQTYILWVRELAELVISHWFGAVMSLEALLEHSTLVE